MWLMRVVVLHPYTKIEVCRPWHWEDMAHDVSALMGLVTLSFDLLTLKLVCESHQRWGTFSLNLGTLCLRFLQLFAMYATARRIDGRTKATLNAPFPTGGGIINDENILSIFTNK